MTWSLTAVYYSMWYIAMYHICIVPSARQLVWGGVWHNWAFVLHSPQLWINHPLFKAEPCILLCLTSPIARTLYLINVYHCLGGLLHSTLYCTFETILELFYWRRHTLGHILSWPQAPACSCHWNKDGSVHVWVTHCEDKASFRFHRKASRKVWKRYPIH